MDVRDFEELTGRIEGLARCVMVLAGSLQRAGCLNEQKLQADLRIAGQGLNADVEGRSVVVRTLNELSDQLLADYLLCSRRAG